MDNNDYDHNDLNKIQLNTIYNLRNKQMSQIQKYDLSLNKIVNKTNIDKVKENDNEKKMRFRSRN